MSEIQNKIEKLKTIQESMDVLTDSLVVNPVAKESTIIEESQSIKDKINNIKLPEIDTTELAKQGENQEATNTAILEAVSNIVDTKNLYSVRFESNNDGPNTYTMVLPVVAGVVGDTIIL